MSTIYTEIPLRISLLFHRRLCAPTSLHYIIAFWTPLTYVYLYLSFHNATFILLDLFLEKAPLPPMSLYIGSRETDFTNLVDSSF